MIRNLIDFDGTLVDTRRAIYLSYKNALEKFNIVFEEEYFNNFCFGKNSNYFLEEILLGSQVNIEEVKNLKQNIFSNMLPLTTVNFDLFNSLILQREDFLIVSHASIDNILKVLNFHSIYIKPNLIISREKLVLPKSDASLYLKLATEFNLDLSQLCLYDDDEVNLRAAKKAGIKAIKIDRYS